MDNKGWERGRERGRKREQFVNGNGDEDGNEDEKEDEIGESGREAKKGKKPHTNCRHDQAPYSVRIIISADRGWRTRQLRSQGPVPVHTHRTEEVTGSK